MSKVSVPVAEAEDSPLGIALPRLATSPPRLVGLVSEEEGKHAALPRPVFALRPPANAKIPWTEAGLQSHKMSEVSVPVAEAEKSAALPRPSKAELEEEWGVSSLVEAEAVLQSHKMSKVSVPVAEAEKSAALPRPSKSFLPLPELEQKAQADRAASTATAHLAEQRQSSSSLEERVLKEREHMYKKKLLAHEYTRLSLQFESALIQHKLALQYFDFRAFYFVFLPVTTIATLITIIGFLISGTTQDDGGGTAASAAEGSVEFEPLVTGQSKQIWSLVVGILGAITTLFNAIGKRSNYQSQSDMHRSAVKALEKICLTVDFERDWFDRNVHDNEYSDSDEVKDLDIKLGADLKTHQASFKAMLDACCDSPIPYEVVQAFTVLEQIVGLQTFADLRPLMYHYHKLWKEYSTYRWWPLKAPSITVYKKYKKWEEERLEIHSP